MLLIIQFVAFFTIYVVPKQHKELKNNFNLQLLYSYPHTYSKLI